jgi:hypothetical protein
MKQLFPMIPAGSATYGMFLGIGMFMLLFLVLIAYLAWTARHASFEVSREGLTLHGGLYGRTIPAAELDFEGARATDLASDPPHSLSFRRNGVGMPGYDGGWFQLQDGEKALVFLTDRRRVAYIPTRSGYAVMLSVADPAAMVSALRQSAAR